MTSPTVHIESASPNIERVRPYEMAARIYCKKVELDPDHEIRQPHPELEGVTVTQPFWTVVADRMIDLSMMLTSIRESREAMLTSIRESREANDA